MRNQPAADEGNPNPPSPGQPEVVDYEYERNGTANLFLAFAPNENWRTVKVTDRRGTGRTSSGSLPTSISPTGRSYWTI